MKPLIRAQAEARAKEANKSREAADERIARLNSAIGKEEDGHAAEAVAFASLSARQRAVSTAANDCRARGDALRAQLESTTEERDEYQNSVIKLEQQLKEAKDERDAATKAAGVIQAKLDAANEDIEKNAGLTRRPFLERQYAVDASRRRRGGRYAIDAPRINSPSTRRPAQSSSKKRTSSSRRSSRRPRENRLQN